jgi:hypothetical protein
LTSPRMERVRWMPKPPRYVKDIEVFLAPPHGVLWVYAQAGGVSTAECSGWMDAPQKR